MIKTILIDDEKNCLDLLDYQLKNLSDEILIIDKIQDSRVAVEKINSLKPDLVFMDIEMPWMSGFDILNKLDNINFHLVFVTSYNQYAINAFKYFAIDYILKPANESRLLETIKRIQNLKTVHNTDHLKEIIASLSIVPSRSKKLAIPVISGYEFYKFDHIIRCESESNYTKIILSSGDVKMVSKTLKVIEGMLDDIRFFKTHKSHLINMDFMVKYEKTDGGNIYMEDLCTVPLSRLRKAEFIKLIKEG